MALRNCSPHNLGLGLRLGLVSSSGGSSSCRVASLGVKQRGRVAVKRQLLELQVFSFSERCMALRGSCGGRVHLQPAGHGESTVLGSLRQGRNGAPEFLNTRRLTIRRAASRPHYNVPQQQPETVPLWLWICAALYRTVGDAIQFLWEQPGQLKDIEWPSFQSTIRMAALTVVVVAFLIIFLATVDSTFSYVLSRLLRRVA